MLRTLGRNGFVERSIAARRHKTLLVRGQYTHLALRPTTAAFTHSRLLATTTPQIKSDPSASKSTAPIPPEPNVSIPRKPKVDLKPAPVKPIIAKTTLPEPVPTSQAVPNLRIDKSKLQPSDESADQPSTAASSTTSSPTIAGSVEEARHDIKKAEEQGVLAPPPADAGRVRRLLHHAKELLKFYWNGLVMINTHRRQVAEIKLRVKEGGEPISRAEYRFMRTHKQDLLKLIPFMVVVLLMEELIPLIAIYVPGMLPSTTVLPSQRKRIEEKAMEKQATFGARRAAFARIVQAGKTRGNEPMVDLQSLRALGSDCTEAVCGVLRLATWGPAPILLYRIDRHLSHIAKDDELLAKDDMGMLDDAGIGKALDERGIIATNYSNKQGRKQLEAWLMDVSSGSNDANQVARRIFAVARANA
ncbi:hypothetical protein PILCRDRAFT_810009 [Piloderma croceum F 1598]|uniref:Letm1 RBD domain-containing protein n=1 Tax=Piloderma croceum (strain F 1598) TaxID=765440 RepID=A0A0C3CQU1_PILCF|nr:hypothetical protein PILCRDRAFT_810009 [Piloderma croceum F 1598]